MHKGHLYQKNHWYNNGWNENSRRERWTMNDERWIFPTLTSWFIQFSQLILMMLLINGKALPLSLYQNSSFFIKKGGICWRISQKAFLYLEINSMKANFRLKKIELFELNCQHSLNSFIKISSVSMPSIDEIMSLFFEHSALIIIIIISSNVIWKMVKG